MSDLRESLGASALRCLIAALVLSAGALAATTKARAQSTPRNEGDAGQVTPAERAPESRRRLRWPTQARRPGWLEAGVGTASLALGVALPILFKPSAPRWTGGILMDGWVRGGLHLSRGQRANAVTASNVMLYSTLALPFVELAAEGLARRLSADLALRILLVELQAFGVAGFVTALPKVAAARERPYGRRCASDPTQPGCDTSERYVSFFSGHTSLTFTAAGLSCVMHRHLHLYGRSGLDAAACGLALGAAAATGALRIVGDQHWTSDVLVGAAVGLLSGWLMPYLLYFRNAGGEDDASLPSTGLASGVVSPWASPSSAGVGYNAIF